LSAIASPQDLFDGLAALGRDVLGVDHLDRPLMVACTTFMALLVPMHLASTFCTPTTSNTARIAPPAMMPVPSEAGCM
jgi:hypothetical protein